jgi:hypothetical protein
MRIYFISLIVFIFFPISAFSGHVGVGQFLQNMESQDSSGSKVSKADDLFISYGKNFPKLLKSDAGIFAPIIGYVKHNKTADTYGDHTKETIFVLYDLAKPLTKNIIFRYGIGNFITRIKGDGGAVSVPNGSNGTSTAYKPGSKSESFTTTLNLGLELFTKQSFFSSGKGFGFRLETFMFSFLDSEKRGLGYSLMVASYF